jgi:hypothetical protein
MPPKRPAEGREEDAAAAALAASLAANPNAMDVQNGNNILDLQEEGIVDNSAEVLASVTRSLRMLENKLADQELRFKQERTIAVLKAPSKCGNPNIFDQQGHLQQGHAGPVASFGGQGNHHVPNYLFSRRAGEVLL